MTISKSKYTDNLTFTTMTLTKRNFALYEIEGENRMNFIPMDYRDVSDFYAEALKWVGNALRPKDSDYFWIDGAFYWWTENQQHEQCVWITTNGILMLEDTTNGTLYRVEFI